MAEEVVTSLPASPVATPDHNKRKHEELVVNNAPEPLTESESNVEAEPVSVEVENGADHESEAKRPRLEVEASNVDEPNGDEKIANQNGSQEDDKAEEPKEEELQPETTNTVQSETDSLQPEAESSNLQPKEGEELLSEAAEMVTGEQVAFDENEQPENKSLEEQEEPTEEAQEPSAEVLGEGDVLNVKQETGSETGVVSRKMEVPNDKVGVLIGKSGETIRSLQDNSGAKIQIVRDADADPRSASRPVELIGTLESIAKAEKLMKDVIAEADAGGSPSLVARGFNTVQAAAGGEQLEIQVPNEKVGLIIGKSGETIKNLQTRSGARIQLIPQHLPEGDQSKDRTVRVTGNKKQIEMASEMMKEVMNQNVRKSSLSGGYSQQGFRPRGPPPSQWGSRGPHHAQYSRYDMHRGQFPSQNPQYPTPSYGNYPPQQGPRSNYGPSWEQRPPVAMQAPSPQANYNYGQSQAPDYGQPTPYSQTPAQHYGHGYGEVKYDPHASAQHFSQTGYSQGGGTHPGYPPQDQYGKPPTYGMPPRGPQPQTQSYAQPRPNQPGEIPYQAPVSSTQAYSQNVPPQQSYPYPSSAPMQQNYPPYGTLPSTDGYNHPPPATAASAGGYPQQAAQPVAGYGQPGGQQPPYGQTGPTGGYPYPTSQAGYTEQPATNNAAYGYQAPADPAYGGAQAASGYAAAPPAGQLGYSQAAPAQPGYDQSAAGVYGSVPVAAGYGKSASPQPQPGYPQYDASQAYGAHR